MRSAVSSDGGQEIRVGTTRVGAPRPAIGRRARSTTAAHVAAAIAMLASAASAFASEPAAAVIELQPVRAIVGSVGDGLDYPLGVAIDARRREVLVSNTGKHRIDIFDLEGRARGRYLHRVEAADRSSMLGRPAKLAIDASGRTLIADQQASYVDVADFRGRSIARLDLARPVAGCPAIAAPAAAIAVTAAGEILVASSGEQGKVFRFGRDYKPLGCWGESGADSARLTSITGLASLPDGRVAVTCAATHFAVQVFEADGRFVVGFGVHDVGDGNFSLPSGVVATPDGRIWVSDELRHTIQVFDSAGRYQGMWGGQGARPGEFLYPSALASDGGGYLAVCERVGSRVQLLRVLSFAP